MTPAELPKVPEVLAERAAADLVDGRPQRDGRRSRLLVRLGSAPRAKAAPSGSWYRTSPQLLVPQNLFHFMTLSDPPSDGAGMATVVLDLSGRLMTLSRIAAATEPVAAATRWPHLVRRRRSVDRRLRTARGVGATVRSCRTTAGRSGRRERERAVAAQRLRSRGRRQPGVLDVGGHAGRRPSASQRVLDPPEQSERGGPVAFHCRDLHRDGGHGADATFAPERVTCMAHGGSRVVVTCGGILSAMLHAHHVPDPISGVDACAECLWMDPWCGAVSAGSRKSPSSLTRAVSGPAPSCRGPACWPDACAIRWSGATCSSACWRESAVASAARCCGAQVESQSVPDAAGRVRGSIQCGAPRHLWSRIIFRHPRRVSVPRWAASSCWCSCAWRCAGRGSRRCFLIAVNIPVGPPARDPRPPSSTSSHRRRSS